MRLGQTSSALNGYRRLSLSEDALSKSLPSESPDFQGHPAARDVADHAPLKMPHMQNRDPLEAIGNAEDAAGFVQAAKSALNRAHPVTIADGIESVSMQRAVLSAIQDRLDHEIAYLAVAGDNLRASECRGQDTTMVSLTRHDVIAGAGTAVLSGAGQVSFTVDLSRNQHMTVAQGGALHPQPGGSGHTPIRTS